MTFHLHSGYIYIRNILYELNVSLTVHHELTIQNYQSNSYLVYSF